MSILVTANTGAASASLTRLDRRLKGTAATADKSSARIVKAAKIAGVGVAAGVAGSVVAAARFESAFAEVHKTVEATEPQFKRIETGLRNMAKEIPVSANELANLAGEAGALGIKSKDIVRFTRVAADLGVTTDLSATDAANALARLGNILDVKGRKAFERMGSTLVDLGNKGASTEDEITEMSLRIARGAGIVGLSTKEVLGLSASLANVGIRAEAGGSSVSRALLEMNESIAEGGEGLETFAQVSGMTTREFSKLFSTDAPAALDVFARGLVDLDKSGKPLMETLQAVGLNEIRVRDALLGLGGAQEKVSKAQNIASEAWRENTALTQEAQKRYDTTAAKFQVFKNRIIDVAVSLGTVLLPAVDVLLDGLAGIAEGIAAFIRKLAAADGWIKNAALAMGAATLAVTGLSVAFSVVSTRAIPAVLAGLAALRGAIMAHPIGALAVVISGVAGALGVFSNKSSEAVKSQDKLGFAGAKATQAIKRQEKAMKALNQSSSRVRRLKDEERKATRRVKEAEDKLARVRKNAPANSKPALDAQRKLVNAKLREERVTKRLKNAEREHGILRKTSKPIIKDALGRQRQQTEATKDQRKEIVKQIRAESQRQIPNLKILSRLHDDLSANTRRLTRAKEKEQGILRDAAQRIGPNYAKTIEKMDSVTLMFGRQTARQTERAVKEYRSLTRGSAKGSGAVVDNFWGMSSGVGGALKTLRDNLNRGLKAMKVGSVKWSIENQKRSGGFTPKFQRGGLIPGQGDGDKVPVMAEPGEGFINKRATRALGGKKAIDAINSAVPRFQTGGMVGLNPGIARLAKFANERFGLTVSSGLRPGDPGHHGSGSAVDLVPPSMGATRGIFSAFKNQLAELFYDPWGGFDNGQMIGPIGDHMDHIHAAILGAGGPAAGIARLKRLLLKGPKGPLRNMGQGALDKAHKAARKFLASKSMASHGNLGSAAGALSEAEFLSLARRAIKITGASGFSPQGLLALAMQESSLIPSSINNWDINAKAGNPSGGLMHLTQSNMRAYAHPKLGSNMFNPLASIAASIRYQLDRYGRQVTFSPYREGGVVPTLDKGGRVTGGGLAEVHPGDVHMGNGTPNVSINFNGAIITELALEEAIQIAVDGQLVDFGRDVASDMSRAPKLAGSAGRRP